MIIDMLKTQTERHIANCNEDIGVFTAFLEGLSLPISYQYFVTLTIDNISGETIPTNISTNELILQG